MTEPKHVGAMCILASMLSIASPLSWAREHGTMAGDVYSAPLGDFQCQIHNFDARDTKFQDGFGPHGGTASFQDFFGILRIDVEEFDNPMAATEMTPSNLAKVHAWYFDEQLVPLVKSGVKKASVVSRRFQENDGNVYLSLMRLPTSKDQAKDMFRSAVQYTNGRFMYVVSYSRQVLASPWTATDDQADSMKKAFESYKSCHFPGLPATGAIGDHP